MGMITIKLGVITAKGGDKVGIRHLVTLGTAKLQSAPGVDNPPRRCTW